MVIAFDIVWGKTHLNWQLQILAEFALLLMHIQYMLHEIVVVCFKFLYKEHLLYRVYALWCLSI